LLQLIAGGGRPAGGVSVGGQIEGEPIPARAGGIDHHEAQTLRLLRTEALGDGPWAGASGAKSGGVGVALLPSVGDGTRALMKR
jgi:hypothetical protein